MQPDWNHPKQSDANEQRRNKMDRLYELIEQRDDEQSGLDKLVALSMRTGYELGRQAK